MTPVRKILLSNILALLCLTSSAQTDLSQYLEKNKYSFSLDKGFDKQTIDSLKIKFKDFKLILQAEGGSHYLKFYSKLHLLWAKTLSKNLGVRNIFLEFGAPAAVCVNNYLKAGDSTKLFTSLYLKNKPNMELWKPYFDYNKNSNSKISFFGIDFNRPSSYLKALKQLLPENQPNESISKAIEIIKGGDETNNDCSYILKLNSKLKEDLNNNKQEFMNFIGKNYLDFERIIINEGTCKDERRNRNYNMVDNFLLFDSIVNDNLYYGELGMAHTILKNKVFASILNEKQNFKNKVCVINIYCHNCSTPEEKVSNYPLSKIEDDIINYFLPLCSSDFTIFDLSGSSELVSKYKEYGQFLILAKNQN